MYQFEDKVAFITGALGVLGKVYITALIKHNIKGIALVDLQEEDTTILHELSANSTDIIYIKADISNHVELKNAFEKTIQHFGQLDIVINNAGIANEENYELCLKINFLAVVNGTLMAMKEYLPKYKISSGVIVNTASITGVIPMQYPVYSLSKHAVVAIGLCYANDEKCKQEDIRVLTICPSAISSPLSGERPLYATAAFKDRKYVKYSKTGEYLVDGLIKIINEGVNGSVWMFAEGKEAYKVDYQPIQKPAMEYILT